MSLGWSFLKQAVVLVCDDALSVNPLSIDKFAMHNAAWCVQCCSQLAVGRFVVSYVAMEQRIEVPK